MVQIDNKLVDQCKVVAVLGPFREELAHKIVVVGWVDTVGDTGLVVDSIVEDTAG